MSTSVEARRAPWRLGPVEFVLEDGAIRCSSELLEEHAEAPHPRAGPWPVESNPGRRVLIWPRWLVPT